MKNEKKPNLKQSIKKVQKESVKKYDSAKKGIKDISNINRYTRYLFVLETILFVGVASEYFEQIIMDIDFGMYINILFRRDKIN